MHTHRTEDQTTMTPWKALQFLREGNDRFVANLLYDHDLLPQVNRMTRRQFPMAAVLSCSDCRVPPELLFDQALGDLHSVRVAGNVLSEDVLGSLEHACALGGSKLVVVLGHSGCRTVGSACAHLEVGNITPLLSKIQPSVRAERSKLEDRTEDPAFVDAVASRNAWRQMQQLLDRSPLLQDLFDAGRIGFAAAMFNSDTGVVEFIETVLPETTASGVVMAVPATASAH